MAKPRAAKSPKPQPALGAPRFVCIHGHFYQPPREKPWLETVEVQDSAAPYHDWNDCITAECYAPIDAFRLTLPGKILLGRYFSLKNIAAYILAIALIAILDRNFIAQTKS